MKLTSCAWVVCVRKCGVEDFRFRCCDVLPVDLCLQGTDSQIFGYTVGGLGPGLVSPPILSDTHSHSQYCGQRFWSAKPSLARQPKAVATPNSKIRRQLKRVCTLLLLQSLGLSLSLPSLGAVRSGRLSPLRSHDTLNVRSRKP